MVPPIWYSKGEVFRRDQDGFSTRFWLRAVDLSVGEGGVFLLFCLLLLLLLRLGPRTFRFGQSKKFAPDSKLKPSRRVPQHAGERDNI